MGGLTSFLLLLCVGVALSAVLDLQKRILAVHTCKGYERPYHVKLIMDDGTTKRLCGGSLISKSWILTAAHCWRDGWTIMAEIGVHPGPGRPVQITAIPKKFKDVQKRDHDIMLLRLPDSTQVNDFIPLPDCGRNQQPTVKKEVNVAGHGHSTPCTDILSETLKCANMTVFPCMAQDTQPEPKKYMFCAKTLQGQTPQVKICDGDSGGGVVFNGKIYGVISSSQNPDFSFPEAGFMKVCEYKDWITDIIKKK